MAIFKTEHAGAKNGDKILHREEVKRISRKCRRRDDVSEITEADIDALNEHGRRHFGGMPADAEFISGPAW